MTSCRGQLTGLRRSLTLAILLGLLLVPATCSHAAGPHSIFIDPRGETAHHEGDHDNHTLLEHVLFSETHRPAAEPADTGSVATSPAPAGQPMLHDLPTTMLVTIAASNVVLDLPELLAIPAADSPEAPLVADRLAGIETAVEAPPPRDSRD